MDDLSLAGNHRDEAPSLSSVDTGAGRRDLPIPQYLLLAANAVPQAAALILDGDHELSYEQWRVRANRFARGLRRLGVGPGDRVGLLYDGEHWLEYAVAYFGVLTLGATAVVLTAWMTPEDLRRLCQRHRVALIVLGAPQAAGADEGRVASHLSVLDAGDDEPEPVAATADSVAEIVFTSGTTGSVKGVEATHASMQLRGKRPDPSVIMHPMPLGSTAAQLMLVDAVRGQQTLVLMSAFDPLRFCRLAGVYAPIWVALAPAMGAMLVRSRAHRTQQLPSVQGLVFVSAPLQPGTLSHLAELFPSAAIHNYYSSAEASPAGVGTIFDPARPTSVGRAEDGSAVRVVDDRGVELPAGEEGEVLLRAEHLASRRYADDERASAAVFRDGWVYTGDLGHLDGDGFLYLTGRKADVVNAGGYKVAAIEVEMAIAAHPLVSEVAVIGLPDELLGEAVVAVVIAERETDPAELTRFCLERLPRIKVPARFIQLQDFPRNAVGKPLKRELVRQLGRAYTSET
jgi:acyl-CoA synthetase (AMP-forming)/AMP-acid ligase II